MAGSVGKKSHAYSVLGVGGQGKAQFGTFFPEKLVGDLDQDTRPITAIRVMAAGAAMLHVDEHMQGVFDDVVGFLPLEVGNKANAAGIVLKLRDIERLLSSDRLVALHDGFRFARKGFLELACGTIPHSHREANI
jgi:hypothetical protein